MPLSIQNVNVLIHGLFFMTLNPATNFLEIFAPVIPGHHFIGGVRGIRTDLAGKDATGKEVTGKIVDLTQINLTGKRSAGTIDDVPGSVLQFLSSETGVGGIDTGNFLTKFKGKIVLPWPKQFISIRNDTVDKFRYKGTSAIGTKVELASRRKGNAQLGVGVLLRYTLDAASSSDLASVLNLHFYLQPGHPHKIPEVNQDLRAAKPAFTIPDRFDLELDEGTEPDPIDPGGDAGLGTTEEDEKSVDEDIDSPDIKLICANDPPMVMEPQTGTTQPAVSPINCPTFF